VSSEDYLDLDELDFLEDSSFDEFDEFDLEDLPAAEAIAVGDLSTEMQVVVGVTGVTLMRQLVASGRVPHDAVGSRLLMRVIEESRPLLQAAITPAALSAAQRGRNSAINTINQIGSVPNVPFSGIPNRMLDAVRQSAFNASVRTMNRLTGNIKDVLETSFREGLGIQDTRQLLEDVFVNMERFELNRIARTEIQHFQNQGSFETMQELGVHYHEWVTAGDDRVRQSHADIHGEIVVVGELFSNGLRYPLDESGPSEEWVNCRCRTAPFIVPPDMVPPDQGPFYASDLSEVMKQLRKDRYTWRDMIQKVSVWRQRWSQ